MATTADLAEFLEKAKDHTIFDVRSPREYEQGHIPGALNLPLLDDDARREVGITFKREGREKAILKGFDLCGTKFSSYIEQATQMATSKHVFTYCWRGGLRSNIMTWLLSLYGFQVTMLKNGYKTYMRWALQKFEETYPIIVVGGLTGSGKTIVLHQLADAGEQIIDLEQLAHHKGSTFGALGQEPQPTNEQFENDLALKLHYINKNKNLWLEDESRQIGKVNIPDHIYRVIRKAPVVKINRDDNYRVEKLEKEYANFPVEELIESTTCLRKRLGDLRLRQSIEFLLSGDKISWVKMMLQYYDKMYIYGLSQREINSIYELNIESVDSSNFMEDIKSLAAKIER